MKARRKRQKNRGRVDAAREAAAAAAERALARTRAPIPDKGRRKGGPQGAGLQKPAWMLSK